ncbi:tyrosine-type recombinase/integrase [Gordonia soli]|uniref:Putative tyrosine recombinase n=1 Tax=Gordonia soli NBRC 108243 TaxID=1223545 RepID=M0QQN5_9ACTN|nr:tyrosine-type recombinase/integrase [Gordonia soli]GAC70709.1 putative tyrosine recombinase [Gordonia soli NBRC 108243]
MNEHDSRLIIQWRTSQFAQSLSKRTVTERAAILHRFANTMGVSPSEATMDDLVEWLASGEDWSPGTRNTYYRAMRAWFLWLQRTGHRIDNPMINITSPRVPRAEPKPLSDDNLRRVLAVRMHKRTRVMIILYALVGMRCAEIAKIRGENFDLVERTVTFTGKGGVKSTLPLHPLVVDVAWMMPREGWWFPTNSSRPEGGHIRGKSVGHIIKQAIVRAGAQGSAHSLRHWFGTALVDSGVDLRTTQELMRHASLATTAKYTKVKDQRKVEGIHRLDPWKTAA